jgi:hypothetical protein
MNIWKLIIVILVMAIGFLANPKLSFAETAASSAKLAVSFDLDKAEDQKHIQTLQNYLASKNSPLAPHAKTFIDEANTSTTLTGSL